MSALVNYTNRLAIDQAAKQIVSGSKHSKADDILRRLGARIREIRVRQRFTSRDALADYLKMHRTFIGHLETGRKDFRMTTIIRVAAALDIRLSELFAGLETGEEAATTGKTRRAVPGRQAMLREIDVLEQSLQKLKALASSGQPKIVKRGS